MLLCIYLILTRHVWCRFCHPRHSQMMKLIESHSLNPSVTPLVSGGAGIWTQACGYSVCDCDRCLSLSPVRWSWGGSGVKGLCGGFWDSGVPEDDGGFFTASLGREGLQIPQSPAWSGPCYWLSFSVFWALAMGQSNGEEDVNLKMNRIAVLEEESKGLYLKACFFS